MDGEKTAKKCLIIQGNVRIGRVLDNLPGIGHFLPFPFKRYVLQTLSTKRLLAKANGMPEPKKKLFEVLVKFTTEKLNRNRLVSITNCY